MFAKEWLKNLMNDAEITKPCSARVIISAAQAVGIKRNELKTARKELGMESICIDGVRYWRLPEGENNA